jgi:hypothetical protein
MHTNEQQMRDNDTWDRDSTMNRRQDMRDDGHNSPLLPASYMGRGTFYLSKLKLLPQPPCIARGVYIFYVYIAYYSLPHLRCEGG